MYGKPLSDPRGINPAISKSTKPWKSGGSNNIHLTDADRIALQVYHGEKAWEELEFEGVDKVLLINARKIHRNLTQSRASELAGELPEDPLANRGEEGITELPIVHTADFGLKTPHELANLTGRTITAIRQWLFLHKDIAARYRRKRGLYDKNIVIEISCKKERENKIEIPMPDKIEIPDRILEKIIPPAQITAEWVEDRIQKLKDEIGHLEYIQNTFFKI